MLGTRIAIIKWLIPLALLCLLVWANVVSSQRTRALAVELARQESAQLAREAIFRIEAILTERSNDMALLAGHWSEWPAEHRRAEFEKQAMRIIGRESSYQSIVFLDPESIVRAGIDRDGSNAMVGADRKLAPGRPELHRTVLGTCAPLCSPVVTLQSGEPGIVVYVPVSRNDGSETGCSGIVAARLRLRDAAADIAEAIPGADACLEVTLDGRTVLKPSRQSLSQFASLTGLGATDHLLLLGRRWNVVVHPRDSGAFGALRTQGTRALRFNLAVSALAALLLALALRAVERARNDRERLRQSEETYRALFDGAADAIFVLDAEGRIVDANAAACRNLGYSHAELLGRPGTDIDGPDHAPLAEERLEQVRRNGSGVFETIHIAADGHPIETECNIRLFDYAGEPALLVIARDIGDRKRDQKAIERERDRAQQYLDVMESMLVAIDTDMTVTLVNRKACETLGYPERELLGTNWLETCVPPEIREELREIAAALRGGQPSDGAWHEHPVLTKSGERRLIAWHNAVLRDDDGAVVGLLAHGEDVTEHRAAEDALRRSEEQYRRIVETANEGIWILDEAGSTSFVNRQMAEMLGYQPQDVVGRPVSDFIHEDFACTLKATLERRREGAAEVYEARYVRRDGSDLWVITSGNPLYNDDGSYVGAMGLMTDITERKAAEEEAARLEERVRQAGRLEAIGRLAGGVAHDLNNMLAPIMGFADLALITLDPSHAAYAHIEQVQAAAERARDLTWRLLAFGRRQPLDIRPINLNDLITELDGVLRITIREDIQTRIVLSPELPAVMADATQIEQVLVNLVVNAQDAMPTGGTLTIETAPVYLDDDYATERPDVSAGPHVMLAITDTGEGMTKEALERAFEPFYTTKRPGAGTGLGLASAYGVVRQHGGHMTLYSELGQGTVGKVYLPSITDAAERVRVTTSERIGHGNETIMVVEDDEMVRALTCQMLERAGYRTLEADGAEQALALADTDDGRFDLLLTDVVMPDINGKQLYAQLRARVPGLRVLYMSGYTDDVIAHHGILDPGTHFVAKPFTVALLTTRVREVLDGK